MATFYLSVIRTGMHRENEKTDATDLVHRKGIDSEGRATRSRLDAYREASSSESIRRRDGLATPLACGWGARRRGRRPRFVARPDQVGHGVGRGIGDSAFQLLEVIGDGDGLLAGTQPAERLDLEREPAAGCVGAEDQEDRGMGQDRQLGPDRPGGDGTGPAAGRGRYWVRSRGCRRSCRSPDRRGGRRGAEDTFDGHRPATGRGGRTARTADADRPASNRRFSSRETCRGRWTSSLSGTPRR